MSWLLALALLQCDLADRIVATGHEYLGVPYKFGASMSEAPRRFDCSSFTKYVYGRHGITLPRVSKDQARTGTPVDKDELRKGDLIFFDSTSRRPGIDHVAIYQGGNKILHTYGEGGVRVQPLFGGYWGRKYVSARRVIPARDCAAPVVVEVVARSANVRAGPGTEHAVRGTAQADERYVRVGQRGSWVRVWFDGEEGWIYGGLVRTLKDAPWVAVTWDRLNVRAGPGVDRDRVGVALEGQAYAKVGRSDGWVQIWFGGECRWVWHEGVAARPS